MNIEYGPPQANICYTMASSNIGVIYLNMFEPETYFWRGRLMQNFFSRFLVSKLGMLLPSSPADRKTFSRRFSSVKRRGQTWRLAGGQDWFLGYIM